jgi:hypothetical protein
LAIENRAKYPGELRRRTIISTPIATARLAITTVPEHFG